MISADLASLVPHPSEFSFPLLLTILLGAIWMFGKIFEKLKLPSLFGEMLAGVLVAPLFVKSAELNVIELFGEMGIFFLMLYTGLKTNPDEFLKASRKFFPVAIGGMVLPFIGGYAVGQIFGFSFTASLYMAMGLSITAIAVSARMFSDCKIENSRVARVSLGAGLIDDVLALILFSVVLSIAEGGSIHSAEIFVLLGKTILFFGVIIFLGDTLFRYFRRIMSHGDSGFMFLIILALTFGLIAEAIGLHLIVGAFLAGLFLREDMIDGSVFEKVEDRTEAFAYSFFGPLFFASLAFSLDWEVLTGNFLLPFLLSVVAILGKLFGAGIPAKLSGMTMKESFGVGIAMNGRGAVELILANIGFQAGIISQEIFSALVIMTLVTTLFSVLMFRCNKRSFQEIKVS